MGFFKIIITIPTLKGCVVKIIGCIFNLYVKSLIVSYKEVNLCKSFSFVFYLMNSLQSFCCVNAAILCIITNFD